MLRIVGEKEQVTDAEVRVAFLWLAGQHLFNSEELFQEQYLRVPYTGLPPAKPWWMGRGGLQSRPCRFQFSQHCDELQSTSLL
jgi:hypothetical protein